MTTLLWILIAAQLCMGAGDTLYHHELKERLAWRTSQRHELRLHGIRNLFYAVIFAALSFWEPRGMFAITLAIILGAELIITLKDFVEEDKTRALPATERVLHTLMALNYGAILMGLAPVLLGWSKGPSAMLRADHGLWGWMMLAAAIAVMIFGFRDLHASMRLSRLHNNKEAAALPRVKAPHNVLITGGTGFIGRALIPALQKAGYDVTVLTRDTAHAAHLNAPVKLITNLDQLPNEAQIETVINLAGAPIAALWTRKHRRNMMDSRIAITSQINALIKRLTVKPALLISGSAIGIYGCECPDAAREQDDIRNDDSFAQSLCLAWEAKARQSGIRTALLRTGIVLDVDGGTLGQMLVPTELGGGAVLGTGKQIMSWITRRDIVRLIHHIMSSPEIDGAVNAAAPNPVTNKAFTQALSKALYRPTLVKIPSFALCLLGGLGTEIFMGSQNVCPEKALKSGFEFMDTDIETTLFRLTGRRDD
ncbi:MAG: TIGR01777 family oxidoreductase [Alphaproteobacteria bacterium]